MVLLCTNQMSIHIKKSKSLVDIDEDKIGDLLLSQETIFKQMLCDLALEKAAIRSRKRKERAARQSLIIHQDSADSSPSGDAPCTYHDGNGDINTDSSVSGKQDELFDRTNLKRKRIHKRRNSSLSFVDDFFSKIEATSKESLVEEFHKDCGEESSITGDADFYSELETIIQSDPHPVEVSNHSIDQQEQKSLDSMYHLSEGGECSSILTIDDFDDKHETTKIQMPTTDSIFQKQLLKLDSSMSRSQASQQKIHDWDRKMGLRKNHCATMRLSMRSRRGLRLVLEEKTITVKDDVPEKQMPQNANIKLARSA